ncbi:uncharacterized protein K02A2.6-like isoform X1 [Nylanderia fulva]|uniref:uncharacterized protein K02A2.6-like isoform X1 n=2 Tax=Nylanderia fulva TaxID=613905 RepID=UPI0010FB6C39|nr:uncharacterized protein K02A2.6-like isoform X1 [Nylanderia fulva]
MAQLASTLTSLNCFDCDGDPASVGTRWEKWKRALEIYLLALNIDKPANKRATLLHTGGLTLQDIYYNIPGAHVDEAEGVDVYKVALNKLDEYFSPKQSKVYERHLFRLIKQEESEKFEKFLLKLRNQANKCKFTNIEEHLIDQIVEKCNSTELRKKILSTGDNMTLDQIISEANALEAVSRQLEVFNKKDLSHQERNNNEINKLDFKKYKSSNKQANNRNADETCSRCGSNKHSQYDKKCPARDKRCLKCNLFGHFREYCRTKQKRKIFEKKTETRPNKHKQEDTKTEEVDYIFHLDEDSVINCLVGGIKIEMLIDSGSKCNVITDKTWKYLKEHEVKAYQQIKKPDKVLLPYGSKKPLDIIGSFQADITINTNNSPRRATFYVIRNGTRNLLGKNTAIELGVLQIGLQINAIQPLPKFKDVKITIPIDKTVKPVIQPYRRIPIPLENKVNEKLAELKDSDIIEKVHGPSPWVSPMVPVLKENGEVRICIDMRRANKAIIRENHPLPTMNEMLPNFRQAKYFSRLDIKNAFHQVEIDPDSRYITTFSTSKGLFRYKRLMFGISCAPEIFQKVLERMLLGCEGTSNFIDDIIVYGQDELSHDKRLKKVLEVLKENDVLLNERKGIYKTKKVEFLGHELSEEGIKPLGKYIKVIQTSRCPTTIEELQSFLGLVNFVGKWIPNLATLTEPFRKLLRLKLNKTTNIQKYWTSDQNIAFQDLKESLSKIKTLGYYNPDDKTQVIADASPVGLGTVLIQIDSNGPRIIAYGSKSLTDCEKRYCQTEKEALALVWAVEHFKIYLFGKEFELISDHKPLEIIFGQRSKPCARIERWVLRLQAFKYKVIYQPGKSNIADPLSRLCKTNTLKPFDNENYINQIVEYSTPIAVPLKEIEAASSIDGEILKVKNGVYNNSWDESVRNYKIFQAELCFNEDILLRGNKIVIPPPLRQRVLEAAHEGHPGIVAMKNRLRTKVWWPKIDKDAENMVKSCKGCTLVSAPNPPNPMRRRELPSMPWIDVAIDFLGPLPSNDYLLVIVDYYSRYKEIKVTRNITAIDTIRILKEIFSRLGFPATLTCDNGNQLTSETFKKYCTECGIKLYHTIPYWPQMNGEVERQNRDILKRLKISQLEKKTGRNKYLHT